jgi:hypothetical protein
VQLSEALLDAVEAKAESEALPSAALLRRAITKYSPELDPTAPAIDVERFGEGIRSGSRGPLRQWPRGVSYVLDTDVAEQLNALAVKRSKATEEKTSVADLAREAIILDLAGAAVPTRPLAKDEYGFTSSDGGHDSRDMQQMMDEVWSATNE